MTTILDGPAKGQSMMLRRAVVFLRVTRKTFPPETRKAPVFDALDQPEDTPTADEELFAYKNTGKRDGTCHMRFGGNQKHRSGFYAMGEYAFYPNQPPDEVMRDTDKWRAWCHSQPK